LHLYLEHGNGDEALALALYRWNAQLAAAFWLDFGHFEIAFRNALDARMVKRYKSQGEKTEWLNDPHLELGRNPNNPRYHKQPYKDIASARSRVRNNSKPNTHDQIISETSFGLWHQLVSQKQMFLWPDLAGAFPHAPNRAQSTISGPVSRLRRFRNRIAHHHRIWTMNVHSLYEDLLTVAGYIDPDLPEWIGSGSAVWSLLDEQPC
jgi:hypothetical protein